MEIKTTMATCMNGHPYDTAKYSSCPVCGAQPANSFSATEPVGGGFSPNFTPTEDPSHSNIGNGGYSPNFRPTVDPHSGNDRYSDGNHGDFEETIFGEGLVADGSQTEPVVGWLVCIEGPVRGTDYRIHAGYNFIGRETGDIRIHGDNQISRQNHATVAYDSSEHLYFVAPAAGRNLIRVNGKTILQAVEIKNYDVISIGSTKLLFVALCGEHFSWNQRG